MSSMSIGLIEILSYADRWLSTDYADCKVNDKVVRNLYRFIRCWIAIA